MLQVVVLGHSLSSQSMRFLEKEAKGIQNLKIMYAPIHVSRFDLVLIEARQHLQNLIDSGLKTGGNNRLILVPSGSSLTTLVLAYMWDGLSGDPLEVLNLIRRGNNLYVPSPELPLIKLGSIKEELRKERRLAMPNTIRVQEFTPDLTQA